MAAGAGPLENSAQQDYEHSLILRIQDGERDAFYELIRPYERRVYAAALAILQNEADADDCAQEAFLKALKNIRRFRAEARFSTWLIQIAVNEALMRRRRERANLLEPIEKDGNGEGSYTPRDFADWREIPSEALERKEIREKLAEALRSLGQIYREVFVLRDMEQLSIEETAKLWASQSQPSRHACCARVSCSGTYWRLDSEAHGATSCLLRRGQSHGSPMRRCVARGFELPRRRCGSRVAGGD